MIQKASDQIENGLMERSDFIAKIDLLERKLELCRKQRNKMIGNTFRKVIEDEFDEEIEGLK